MKIDENSVNNNGNSVTRKSSFNNNNSSSSSNRMIKSEITRKFNDEENSDDNNSGGNRRRRLNDYDLIDFDRSYALHDEIITSSSSVRKKDLKQVVPRREHSLMAISSIASQSALSSSSTGFGDNNSFQCPAPDINQVNILKRFF